MLSKIQDLISDLEDRKSELINYLSSCTGDLLRWRPKPDRWSMLMTLQHIILGEQGIRLSEEELRNNPVRQQLKTGNMLALVIDMLEKNIPVEVPHISVEPDGSMEMDELVALWDRERKMLCDLLEDITEETVNEVMFSHPAAGPLDALSTLKLALAHFDAHRRQIDMLRSEIEFI